jgi:hypothetical protein
MFRERKLNKAGADVTGVGLERLGMGHQGPPKLATAQVAIRLRP